MHIHTCARGHPFSESRKRLDTLCKNLAWLGINYLYLLQILRVGYICTCDVRTPFLYLGDRWTHRAEMWCAASKPKPLCFTQVMGKGHLHVFACSCTMHILFKEDLFAFARSSPKRRLIGLLSWGIICNCIMHSSSKNGREKLPCCILASRTLKERRKMITLWRSCSDDISMLTYSSN